MNVREVLWYELTQLPNRMGGWRGIVFYLLVAGGLGVWVPGRWGFEFLNPTVLIAYACFSMLFAGPVAAETFAGIVEMRLREPVTQRAVLLGKFLASAGYGWISAMLMLGAGLVTVNVNNWHGSPLLPQTPFLLSVVGLSLCLAAFTGGLAAAIAVRTTSAVAKRLLRLVFLVLLLLMAAALRFGPETWRMGALRQLSSDRFPTFALIAGTHLVFLGAVLLRVALGRVAAAAKDEAAD